MPKISLSVHGRRYDAFKRVRVTVGLEHCANSFEFESSKGDPKAFPVFEGDDVEVKIGDVPVLRGKIDRRQYSVSAGDHSFSVAGRSSTAVLVDSSFVPDDGKWEIARTTLHTLVKRVARQFDIPVRFDIPDVKLGSKVSINPGDTAFEVIHRAAWSGGALVYSDAEGGLVVGRIAGGRPVAHLAEGTFLGASATFDNSQRFALYRVTGQSPGDDHLWGEAAAVIKGSATDPNKHDKSVLMTQFRGAATIELCRRYAGWLAATRKALALTASVLMQGWTRADGSLWTPNTLVSIAAPSIGLAPNPKFKREGISMIVVGCVYTHDDSGSSTDLQLRMPGSFTPEPVVKPDVRKGTWPEAARGV